MKKLMILVLLFILTVGTASAVIIRVKIPMEGPYSASTKQHPRGLPADIEIRNITSPYAVVSTGFGIIDSVTLKAQFFLDNAAIGVHYIVITSDFSALETWSRSGGEDIKSMQDPYWQYDFSDDSTKAYESNIIRVDSSPLVYSLYGGDVDNDDAIDATDLALIDYDAENFAPGYHDTDVNVDGTVDGADMAIADNNASNFVTIARP